ncbi:bestrophin family ion channel, partial [Klebsiella pneumoniae]|uniref:bestrophin family ion channel n=1 Tax=Klebsiella pneumoniae TaxID=573 RepID=UPI002849D6CF
GMVCVVGRMRDLILQLSKSSIYSTKPFLSWDSLAEELEDPFGTAANDLPLNAMCNTIERNLLDMTGQHPLPETLRPDRYFNLT